MNEIETQDWIKQCEGIKLQPYTDTTGHLTIGWGRNLDRGIRIDEAQLMFQNDFKETIQNLELFDWYKGQPENVQSALINMCFNMGISNLLKFREMIQALVNKDYTKASLEALNSTWAKQVGQRGKDVALMMRQG